MMQQAKPQVVSTHSRLKAAEPFIDTVKLEVIVSTHSRLKAAEFDRNTRGSDMTMFQHTAA